MTDRAERRRALQRSHAGDHGLDVGEAEAAFREHLQPEAHQHVVVGLVAGRAPQRFDPGALGDVDPDLGDQHALEIEAGDLHGSPSALRAHCLARSGVPRGGALGAPGAPVR